MKIQILNKITNQPKKELIYYNEFEKFYEQFVNTSEEDLKKFYKKLSNLSKTTIIKILWFSYKEPSIFNFVKGLNEQDIDFNRFYLYKEFRKKHPHQSGNIEFYKLKYGDSWETYKQKHILKRKNPYELNYYLTKGFSVEESIQYITDLKYRTAHSLQRCIEQYGEVEGINKYKFINQFHKNKIDYWNSEEDFKRYKQECSKNSIYFWMKRGFTKEDAVQIVSTIQLHNAGVHKQYWINKVGEDEAEKIIAEINLKKDGSSLNFFITKYGNEIGNELFEKSRLIKSSCWRNFGKSAKDLYSDNKKKVYYTKVFEYTKQEEKHIEKCPGKRGKNKGYYHLDHIYSIYEGFINKIPPEIIGSRVNLQWLNAKENSSKKQKCGITKKELYYKYETLINENKKY